MKAELTLPWPDKALSPNARGHWAKKNKACRAYRKTCWVLGLEVKVKAKDGPIDVYLTFRPPSKRKYDLDNAIASLKSGLDGVADALGVNDACFRLHAVMGLPVESGAVWVTVCQN